MATDPNDRPVDPVDLLNALIPVVGRGVLDRIMAEVRVRQIDRERASATEGAALAAAHTRRLEHSAAGLQAAGDRLYDVIADDASVDDAAAHAALTAWREARISDITGDTAPDPADTP